VGGSRGCRRVFRDGHLPRNWHRLGRRKSENSDLAHEGTGAIEAAVFALLGLLLGFSLAGATSRLDSRRQLIIQEANAIGTAYLRLDTLAASDQPAMRRLFRDYLDARLRIYQKLPDLRAADQELAGAAKIQQRIWSQAVISVRADATQTAAKLLLPAVNEMTDVTMSRTVAVHALAVANFRSAHKPRAPQRFARRLCHDETTRPKLASHACLCSRRRHHDLCGSRPGLSALRFDSARSG
jgi:hypothetical protein